MYQVYVVDIDKSQGYLVELNVVDMVFQDEILQLYFGFEVDDEVEDGVVVVVMLYKMVCLLFFICIIIFKFLDVVFNF